MQRVFEYQIEASQSGVRIGDFLRSMGYSRHILTHLKQTDCGIMVNGSCSYTNQVLQKGDTLRIFILEEEGSRQILPVPMKLNIVYEDKDLMIINKPSDMPVHPSIGNHENTLANGIVSYFAEQNIPYTYRCINRLDRDTSGLLILAKHMLSSALLSSMSSRHLIRREYFALTEGLLPDSGTISAPIARVCDSAIQRCVDYEHGEQAVTHFIRIGYENNISAALIHLETGRTHQIRVHMNYIGHPLLGDFLYNPGYLERSDCKIRRQALHSCRLTFKHPVTHESMSFFAEPPADIRNCISICDKVLHS